MAEPARVHVIGAGLAGLAASVRLAQAGYAVRLYEAGQQAGGRCRSYLDSELGCRIDNGNHLLLSGNRAALSYVDRIGARATLDEAAEAAFPFLDAATGERWTLRPTSGRLPWWILSGRRRMPHTRAPDYLLAMFRLWRAGAAAAVADVLDPDRPLFRGLWQPLTVAALNTGVDEASAQLFRHLLTETLGRGAAACRPLVPSQGLSESLVDPALATLRAAGAEIRFGARLKALVFAEDRVRELVFDGGSIPLGPDEGAILAVPAAIAERLVPGLIVPNAFAPIVNAHFRYAAPPDTPMFVGIIGGAAEWIFRKREVLSVTVSAGDRFVGQPSEALRRLFWRDVALAYDLPPRPVPPARVIKERRATFLASPAQLRRRPGATTGWQNLLLAGDYVNTGLPATIEGAIRSGFGAAEQVLLRGLSVTALSEDGAVARPARQQQRGQRVVP